MFNINMGIIQKNVEKKKYPQIINILKKSIETIIIIKRILNLEIKFTVSKLLASISAIEK